MPEHLMPLLCPECGKLLGKTTKPSASEWLRLMCRRCKRVVVPVTRKVIR